MMRTKTKNWKTKTIVLAVVCIFIGAGAGLISYHYFFKPKPTPTLDTKKPFPEVNVSKLSIHCPPGIPEPQAYKYARMRFDFKIHNPNDVAVILEKFEYAVYGDGHAVGGAERMVRGEYLDRSIAPHGTINIDFPLPYISKDEDPALWPEMVKGNVIWTIKGIAHIRYSGENELDVPFECRVEDYSLQINERCK
jgi:LEA14-like dessication related protein